MINDLESFLWGMVTAVNAGTLLKMLHCLLKDIKEEKKQKEKEEDYFEKRKRLQKEATERLHNYTVKLAGYLNIPVSYENELGDAAGQITYATKNGKHTRSKKIEILNEYKENYPWVLLHELGHHVSFLKNDFSESGAEREALEICKAFLTKEEQEILSVDLEVRFKERAN
jgi:hypothetical protein